MFQQKNFTFNTIHAIGVVVVNVRVSSVGALLQQVQGQVVVLVTKVLDVGHDGGRGHSSGVAVISAGKNVV